MIHVVAALIESDGKLLVCQRRTGGSFELLWEFPGGKINPGESPEAALARELLEELGVEARIGREVYRTLHQYSELREPIELTFFTAQVNPTHVRNLIFERLEWRTPQNLAELDFLPADRELISKLTSGELTLR
jgi:8-oxo-dGTP diphosphatase